MHWKKSASVAAIALVVCTLWLLWLWQPERQVLKQNASLIRAFEKRKWEKVERLIDAKFSDRWGHDRERVVRESREILRQFFVVEITQEDVGVYCMEMSGRVHARIRMKGSGSPVAQIAMRTINAVQTPFLFEWKRKSWKPWDWQLVGVDNPEFEPPGGGGFY